MGCQAGGKQSGDPALEPRHVGGHVEEEEREGEDAEEAADDGEQEAHEAQRGLASGAGDVSRLDVEGGHEPLDVEVRSEALVGPVDGLVQDVRDAQRQFGDLVEQQVAECQEEEHHEQGEREDDEHRCHASAHPLREPCDDRRDRDGGEPGHEHGEDDVPAVLEDESEEQPERDDPEYDEPDAPHIRGLEPHRVRALEVRHDPEGMS